MMNVTPDPLFDRLVRLRLESVQCLPDSGDWNRLAQALDTLDAAQSAFDTRLGKQLASIEDAQDIPDFQSIENQLGDPFEHMVAARLRATETDTFSPADADWFHLEALLPHSFDQQVQQKLSDYSLPEQPADWSLVEGQLPAGFDAVVQTRLTAAADSSQPMWPEFRQAQVAALAGERLRDFTVSTPPDWPAFERKLAAAEGSRRIRFGYVVARISGIAAAVALLVTAGIRLLTPGSPVTSPGQLLLAGQQPAAPTTSGSTAMPASRTVAPGDHPVTIPLPPQAAPGQPFLDAYAGVPPLYDFGELESYDAEPLLKAGAMIARSSSAWKSGPRNVQADMQQLQPLMGFAPVQESAYRYSGANQPEGIDLPSTDFSPAVWIGATATSLVSVAELNSRGLLGQMGGVRLWLQFGQYWGVVTGVQAGSKQFEQVYLDLSADRTTWIASRTAGKLSVIEFPVLVRYTPGGQGRGRIYLQGGLAPSMTLRECYTITREGTATEAAGVTQEETALRSYAGTLHLAPGMTLPLGRSQHMQLQVEPYLQLSLQPLSDAQSKLSSAGLTVSLLYQVKD